MAARLAPLEFQDPEERIGRVPFLFTQDQGADDALELRGWWDRDRKRPFVLLRLHQAREGYLYLAVDWRMHSLVATAFAGQGNVAKRELLADLERRGYELGPTE